ncbi:hypothetical protein B0T18DRAFT_387719 [Schizothecium vesticola]|uniref:DUF7702 domain-containing protein n=1 Tax=Schizothecium vesticola TaxID=314040 RepID=A0AA40F5M1_9PEZI|nr:hypothetical protein B0T18DRAFT_387719 [Schizothecium vesticola]
MTVNPYTAAAIAEVVLYVPAVPVALYLMIRNWKYRPRTAWYPPAAFSTIRLVGGIMTIIEQQNQSNRGLVVATIVLLNVGLIPLLMAFLGYARLVLEHDFRDSWRVRMFLRLVKICVLVAAGLLGAAGGYAGNPEFANSQSTLSKAAYGLFSAAILALIASFIGMALNPRRITMAHRLYVKWALFAAIPLCVRAVYGIIGVAVASGNNFFASAWSSLFGSATAFGLMALLPEYVVLGIYLYLSAYHLRSKGKPEVVEGGTKHRSDDMS